ncbi:mitochondrial substrate carrier family protein b [Phtheirospermum japonicum]|uniref:Mitochondrial substrate carrier family protein b n=1 Tax=Phtheirospermum japonicum TaxID=374723 RepID=A0A830B9I7_9LAMI|nr:mitochondrial substrate carrier family protein b [Phtheirospermum japonicum]
MQTEARVGVVVEGGGLNTTPSVVVEQRRIGTASQLLAGGLAGAVSKTCTAPLARLTILFQVQGMHSSNLERASIWREASRIVRDEGVRAFWKGNLVTIAHRLPYSSISFYAFEHYKNVGVGSQGDNISADLCIRLVGGGLAGLTAASVTYPLDLVRTRLTAQTNVIYYRGIWHALHTISKEEGVFGLYKGLGATLLRALMQGVGPNLAISFSVYDTARSYWYFHRPEDSSVLVSLACGSFSGIAASTVAYPLDLVRRRMQLEGAGGRARVYKTGIFGTLRHIIRTEGLRGLYRGIVPEYYKVVPSVGIVFMTYEKLKQVLSTIPES